ncbi:MAG: pyruvate carboxyltransferase [Lachnospiraceae bacterium]|nr:pyruvate carboxyltransferase [Lachnospiraceae bacterium]
MNNFNFGTEYMEAILHSLEAADVDIIECGYIDEKNGSEEGRTQYCCEEVIRDHFLTEKKQGVTYVAMMDYGKYDVARLPQRTDRDIDGIRLAFHKKNRHDIIAVGKMIIEKGYQLYIQPMTTMRYSDQELLDLIEEVNTQLPQATAFYIVDSFGEMRANDMSRVLNLVDHNLISEMKLGFHSHNNLQLSYSNAVSFIEFNTMRDRIADVSVMGMGKGAGNLNTELFAEHLNLYFGKNYQIQPLLEVIDTVINQIHSEFYWGYSVEYYLSSINHCTPSYAGHFFKKHMLPIDQVSDLLRMIPEEKKISFDKEFADRLYLEYNQEKQLDDEVVVAALKEKIAGKKVLLIAPGKHLTDADAVIREMLADENAISIALNNDRAYLTDYVLATKQERYEKAIGRGKHVIVTSNVTRTPVAEFDGQVQVIDYKEWIHTEDGVNDSALVVVFNLLREIGVKEVYLAGFDGFSVNINENYMDPNLRRPVTEEQAKERNEFFKKFIAETKKDIQLIFLTESMYNE